MTDLEPLKAKVAATMSAGPSVKVLIDGIAEHLAATMLADGLNSSSETSQFVAQLHAEAPILAHLAEIGTKVNP